MRLVRFADFVITFQSRCDAERVVEDLRMRLTEFGLALNGEKTRLIAFARFAGKERRARGQGQPETFDFLGFTYYCGKTRDGRFKVNRKTQRKRVLRKLKELRQEMKRRRHRTVREQRDWLTAVLRGHYCYYGITGNYRSLWRFYREVQAAWLKALRRPTPADAVDALQRLS